MAHYVCEGECGGISEHPKVCEGESCSKKGHIMVECSCEDNTHAKEGGGAASPENSEDSGE